MSNHHDDPTTVGPVHEDAFDRHSNALAAHVIASGPHADDVSARLEAMQTRVALTVRKAAREWNRIHDILRVLPLELRAMCWSHLPLLDIVRLALVCSSWRDLSRSSPSLWTVLRVSGDTRELDAIFSRSGRLTLDLSTSIVRLADLTYIDGCLSRQAYHLRSLHLSLNGNGISDGGSATALFRYPVPVLEKLCLDLGGGLWRLSPDARMFEKSAPALRSVTLSGCLFPSWCPAFARVTEMAIVCKPGGSLNLGALFVVAPCLEKLELTNISTQYSLPAIPASSRLVDVTICEAYPFRQFVDRGYLGIRSLTVRVQKGCQHILREALEHHPASFDATLRIIARNDVAVNLRRADGAVAHFMARDIACVLAPELFDAPAAAARIRALVLASGSRNDIVPDDNDGSWAQLYLAKNRELPALRTLILAFAPGPADACSLFRPKLERKKIVAPALEQISVLREHEANDDARPAQVNPDQLGEFIREHVVCDAPQALELFIDSHSGVELGADSEALDRLRRSVGNLVL